jgi:hypothetical protein
MAALDESSELYKQLGDEYKDNAKRLNAALQPK